MANFLNRAKYYASSIAKTPFPKYSRCPNCGGRPAAVVDRKYLITSLARCSQCDLLYRRPASTERELSGFYLASYKTDNTNTPSDRSPETYRDLEVLKRPRDYSDYVRVLRALGCAHGAKIFEYGCSWGYGSAQLRAGGFDITGYEISANNRKFAREVLGLTIVDDFKVFAQDLPAPAFDVFFSSHVLEHLARLQPIFDLARRLVKPGGYFVFFVPNGSEVFMKANRARWRRLWGEVHPLFLDERFFTKAFAGEPVLLGASPVDGAVLADFAANGRTTLAPLDGKELTCVVKVGAGSSS